MDSREGNNAEPVVNCGECPVDQSLVVVAEALSDPKLSVSTESSKSTQSSSEGNNVGTVGECGQCPLHCKSLIVVAEVLSDLNLKNAPESTEAQPQRLTKKQRKRLRYQKQKKEIREKRREKSLAAAATAGVGMNDPTVVGSATEEIASSSNTTVESQKVRNNKELNTKKNRPNSRTRAGKGGFPVKTEKAHSKECGDKEYWKGLIAYECSNTSCRKTWNSAHGWTSMSGLNCDKCSGKAKVTNMIEGVIMVEEFRCRVNGCTNSWTRPHDPEELKHVCACDVCGFAVISGGAQEKFGRHFWVTCKNCCLEWEEVTTNKDYTQRCLTCDNPGTMVGTSARTKDPIYGRLGGGDGEDGHGILGCDMCQKLISDGVASSCSRKRRVVMKEVIVNGVASDRIISAK